jgi:F-type H+-transporting ATPase subunit gamma
MAGTKEIRTQIASVKSTQKITKAMQMVATSKMRRAQERMKLARPYAEKIRHVIGNLHHANPDYRHPFMAERTAANVGFIVVTTDRGLAGGLNANLFRTALRQFKAWEDAGKELDLCVIGNKGIAFFNRVGGNIVGSVNHLGDTPSFEDLIGTVRIMLDAYNDGRVDKVYMIYNEFVNSMTQSSDLEQLIPLVPEESDDLAHHWDYIYESGTNDVMEQLLSRYIESLVYQGVAENIACEQAARMVAMKPASDNAGKLIDELQLVYNKARQAAITQELSEIVGGAAAV